MGKRKGKGNVRKPPGAGTGGGSSGSGKSSLGMVAIIVGCGVLAFAITQYNAVDQLAAEIDGVDPGVLDAVSDEDPSADAAAAAAKRRATPRELPHAPGVAVVELGSPQRDVEANGRVIDLAHGEMFDDLLRDSPDEIRAAAVARHHHKATKRRMKAA